MAKALTIKRISPRQVAMNDGIEPSPGLVRSVRLHGVLEPVVLDPDYNVVDGRRRVAAAIKAELDDIPYRVEESSPLLTLVLNNDRSNNPLSEYRAMRQLMDEGMTEHDVAERLGFSVATVCRRLKMDHVLPELLTHLEAGRTTMAIVQEASALSKADQIKVLNDIDNGVVLTSKDIRAYRYVQREAAVQAVLGDIVSGEERRTDEQTKRYQLLQYLTSARTLARDIGEPAVAEELDIVIDTLREE